MDSRHLLATLSHRVVKRIAHDVLRRRNGNGFDGNARIGTNRPCATIGAELNELARSIAALLELNARIEVFGVFAHDHQVNILIAPACSWNGQNRTKACEQAQRLSQRNVHAAKARSDRRRDRAFDSNLISLDGFNGLIRQGGSALFHRAHAGFGDFPLDLRARRFQNALHGGRSLYADTIAWNQRDRML